MTTVTQPLRHFSGVFSDASQFWRVVDAVQQNAQNFPVLSYATLRNECTVPNVSISEEGFALHDDGCAAMDS
jgi:hypothetical protein